jgi:hypothetical protein
MKRGFIMWGWVTSALGVIIVLLMVGQLVTESVWLGRQLDTVGSYLYMPLYVGGVIGLVLIIGGMATAVSARRSNH